MKYLLKPVISSVIAVVVFSAAGYILGRTQRADALQTASETERLAREAFVKAHQEKCDLIAKHGGRCDDIAFGTQLQAAIRDFPRQ